MGDEVRPPLCHTDSHILLPQVGIDGLSQILPSIASAATRADDGATIDNRCHELLRQAGVFRCLLPPRFGGLDVDPLVAMQTIELLASCSGSVGWTAFVGIVGGAFASELDDLGASEVYLDPDGFVAYAGASRGKLVQAEAGFSLTGFWITACGPVIS